MSVVSERCNKMLRARPCAAEEEILHRDITREEFHALPFVEEVAEAEGPQPSAELWRNSRY